ncbi:MAG: ATP phosphoribosyltransferase regulatory subunit [Rhodospirillales bacterium]
MSPPIDKALLPAGMTDALPPHAAFEAETVERLMVTFASYGYERVKPPLIEFEDSLLASGDAALGAQAFRLLDPESRRMLALRPDMTLQVARIATSRLAARPRPLRLSYAGQVVQVKGSQLRPERQFGQVGAEIIGAAAPAADAEVILMAAQALAELGLADLTVDLGLPTLVPALLYGRDFDSEIAARLRAVLDRKDMVEVGAMAAWIGAETAALLARLVAATGPADEALAVLMAAAVPAAAEVEREALAAVVASVRAGAPELRLSIDPVENRGFEYHTGVTFTLFAPDVRGELGRGGRYFAGNGDGRGEPATGVTLFMDSVLRAIPASKRSSRLFLPHGTGVDEGRRFRRAGWITVAGLEVAAEPEAEALRLGCSHVLIKGDIRAVQPPRRQADRG